MIITNSTICEIIGGKYRNIGIEGDLGEICKYFKEVSRRSESMNAVPRLKLRSYDEFDERCKTSTGVAFKGKSCRGLFNVHMTMYAKLLDN